MDENIKLALNKLPEFIRKLKVRRHTDNAQGGIMLEIMWPKYTHYRRKVLRWFESLQRKK